MANIFEFDDGQSLKSRQVLPDFKLLIEDELPQVSYPKFAEKGLVSPLYPYFNANPSSHTNMSSGSQA